MQGPPTTPTTGDEASIPTEHMRNQGISPNLNSTFTVRRKAAKRILPWDLPVDEVQLALPRVDEVQLALPRPQDEDTRETKRPRLEEPVHTSIDEAATKTTSHATTVALPATDATPAAADNDDANAEPVTDTQLNARTPGATGRWTLVEDAKLTTAVTKTRKKKHSKNWDAIAALVPNRTKLQCKGR
jgi:hypothetical protein